MKNKHGEKIRLAALLALLLCFALLPIQGFAMAEETLVSAPAPEAAPAPMPEIAPAPVPETAPAPAPEMVPAPVPDTKPETENTVETGYETQEAEPTQSPIEEPEVTEVPPAPEATAAPETTAAPESTMAPEVTVTPEPTVVPEASAAPENTLMPSTNDVPDPTPEAIGCFMEKKSKLEKNRKLDPANLDIPEDGMPIPRIYQGDYKTIVCTVDGEGKSVSSSGCGATAASMLIAYIQHRYDQTPYSLFYWAGTRGYYSGNGLSYEAVQRMLVRYGVDGRLMGVSSDNIIKHLENDRPIIIKMGPGSFTEEGHYIVLRGLDSQGNVLVNDPNNPWISTQSYPADMIAREAKEEYMLVAYTPVKGSETPAPVQTPKPTKVPAADVPVMDAALDIPKANAVVTGSCVNMRMRPVDGDVAAQAFKGEQLSLLGKTDVQSDGYVWCQVYYQNQKLYMRSDMLKTLS